MRMRHSYLWPVRIYKNFSTLSHKWHDFREKKSYRIKNVFWFHLQLLSETFLILRKIEWDIKNIQSGPKVGIQYSIQLVVQLYTYFWPTLYIYIYIYMKTDIYIYMYIGFHVKCPLFLSDFNETWIFPYFSKNNQISNFMKLRLMGSELLRADRRTDMT